MLYIISFVREREEWELLFYGTSTAKVISARIAVFSMYNSFEAGVERPKPKFAEIKAEARTSRPWLQFRASDSLSRFLCA